MVRHVYSLNSQLNPDAFPMHISIILNFVKFNCKLYSQTKTDVLYIKSYLSITIFVLHSLCTKQSEFLYVNHMGYIKCKAKLNNGCTIIIVISYPFNLYILRNLFQQK